MIVATAPATGSWDKTRLTGPSADRPGFPANGGVSRLGESIQAAHAAGSPRFSRIPPWVMKRLIFLDIDGVLNSVQFRADNTNGEGVVIVNGAFDATAHIDPQRVARLNRLIRATNAEVVLSSSWRKLFGLERTQASLKAKGFAYHLADCTVRLPGELRRVEIESYLAAFGTPPRFVILDDDEKEVGDGFGLNFVHVPDGLDDEHVERASRRLLEFDSADQNEAGEPAVQ